MTLPYFVTPGLDPGVQGYLAPPAFLRPWIAGVQSRNDDGKVSVSYNL